MSNSYDLIEEYLVHSYLYYVIGDTVLNDAEFDQLCVELTRDWDKLESPFKSEVDIPDDRHEGTVDFQFKGQDGQEDCYSSEIKRRAHSRISEHWEMLEIWKDITL